MIPRRRLGRGGPEVSAIGLGCMGMSEFHRAGDEETGTLHLFVMGAENVIAFAHRAD